MVGSSIVSLKVLILVLVEHALGVLCLLASEDCLHVLILVLVEHALGDSSRAYSQRCCQVLILVLVEHALGVQLPTLRVKMVLRLNPCFSGTCSRSPRDISL